MLAVVADADSVYIVADSDETETGRVRLPLAQYPHIRSAFETGEMTSTAAAVSRRRSAAETTVVFPMIVGRKPVGALLVRFPDLPVSRIPVADGARRQLAAAIIGMVLRGARALDPIRERTRQITLSDVQRGAPGARHRALPRLHRQRLRRHRGARRRRARSST